jgi:hypothetical protein
MKVDACRENRRHPQPHEHAGLFVPERSDVGRRLGLHGRGAQLVLIGKDGGIKARHSEDVFDLERIFTLIDSMPMRRAEMRQW